ncbi:hypothetical protein CERSUDRAFT_113664 [Gelatoporia subvermispora B]|uniref:Zn(2)-C6 fungal-type domain-containing protein n=1 Tax=Ceriporiopsis subvermispora (strain B) TaxID=914234 RepID=M2QN95_CERS8|nr:hypothetical protein CERSUDRAFT_113664 [Gelatoporia subvermispora B]
MRRVRCDLKDLPVSGTGQHPPCSNCSERGLKCVDEFAEVKAVKLLRRGRRLQQVEAVYGKNAPEENSLHSVAPPRSIIPKLRPEFFSSPFFRRFGIQRPVIEPVEFYTRYMEYSKGDKDVLQYPGELLALTLVIWAASFGVNEFGQEEAHDGPDDLRQRKDRVNEMLHEMLYLIDVHGLLRKPSWDGVRVLLLILPLTQEVQSPLDRLTMYEAIISQVRALCSLAPSVKSGQGEYVDALVRARIYWYAHVVDGISSGLRGGRLQLTESDLSAFEATLPALGDPSGESASYAFTYRYATIPIRIASICRQVHTALTGPKARHGSDIDEERLHDAWDALDQCWKDFDGLRQFGTSPMVQAEDMERFIDGWQIFIFECHNVIREALKQRLVSRPTPDSAFLPDAHPMARTRKYETLVRLHAKASLRCNEVVRHVVAILRRNLGTPFFQYDAKLIRDGCFFAGFLLASESGTTEEVETCLQALTEMRWAFSKSEEREQTVRMVWESRSAQPRIRNHTPGSGDEHLQLLSASETQYPRRSMPRSLSIPPLSLQTNGVPDFYGASAPPSTACSADGNWPSTLSTGSPSAEQYNGSIGSHRSSPSSTSRSSPYVRSPQDALAMPLGRLGQAGCSDQPYYMLSYNYLPGESGDAHSQSNPMSAALSSEHPPGYAAAQYFDTAPVVFSGAPIGHSSAGTGDIATPSLGTNGSSFGSAFYH